MFGKKINGGAVSAVIHRVLWRMNLYLHKFMQVAMHVLGISCTLRRFIDVLGILQIADLIV